MDHLLTFAELSLGLAGVAALIAAFRDHTSHEWNKMQFMGLIGHSTLAFFFSLFPFFVNAFTKDPTRTWMICSFIFSFQIFSQVVFVPILDQKSSWVLKSELMIFGLLCSIALLLNGSGIYFNHSIEAYYLGILFHLIQGAFIFFIFILGSQLPTSLKILENPVQKEDQEIGREKK
jgi:hypothetical protein